MIAEDTVDMAIPLGVVYTVVFPSKLQPQERNSALAN